MFKLILIITLSYSLVSHGKVNFSSLIDSSNNKVSVDNINSNTKVISFFFSSCAHTCLLINNKLKELHKKIPKESKTQIVSITVDPEYDTVARLSTYSKKWRSNSSQWLFITGEPKEVFRVIKEEFKLKGGGSAFVHSESVMVFKDGSHTKTYSLFDPKEFKSLISDLGIK